MTRTTEACLLAAITATAACSSSTSSEPIAPAPLTITAVKWNPSSLDVGTVQAVCEQGTSVLVFGLKGVETISAGSLVSSDESITTWKSAAVVPSSDNLSTWLVGIDVAGHIQRVSTTSGVEDVTDCYGLAADKVDNVAGGASRVAFLLESGVAVSDGASVTRYAGPARAVAANGAVVAIADGSAVRVFDSGKETDVVIPDVQLVAYDGTGNLIAATSHALFQVTGSTARQIYDAGGRTIHQLAGAGANVWLSVDGDLGVWTGGSLALASGGTLAADARLFGSASGDVWAIDGGQLLRWSAAGAAGAAGGDEATWNASVQPVYAAVCSNCHSPPGSGKDSSNIDLSTYASWSARRGIVNTRVITQAGTAQSMPPPNSGFTLTDAQRAAIEAWSKP